MFVKKLNIKLCGLVAVVAFLDFIFGAIFVFHMQNSGLTPFLIGALFAVSGLLQVVFETPTGLWGDRYGHRRILLVGLVLWGVGQAMFGVAESTLGFLLALSLWGVGQAFYTGAPGALVVNLVQKREGSEGVARTVRLSQTTRWCASAGGAATMALLGGGFESAYLLTVSGLLMLLAALWVRLSWPEQRSEGLAVKTLVRRGVRAATRGEIAWVMAQAILIGTVLSVLILSWQPVAVDELGMSPAHLGIVLLVFTAVSAFGAWGAKFFEGFSPTLVVTAALALTCGLLMTVGVGVIVTGVAFLIAEVVIALAACVNAVNAQQHFPNSIRNTLTSLMGVASGLSMALGDLLLGVLWEGFGIIMALRTLMLLLGVASVLTFLVYAFRHGLKPPDTDTRVEDETDSASSV